MFQTQKLINPPPTPYIVLTYKLIYVLLIQNKDHQRMMVDPMFMIVQNLRSFLTAVTPTAVTPTVVAPISVILP